MQAAAALEGAGEAVPRVEAAEQSGGTAPDCARPIVLLKFDLNAVLERLYGAGYYILLHHVDKETISRAYTPLDPRLVMYDQGRALRWEREQRKNEPSAVARRRRPTRRRRRAKRSGGCS